MTQTSVVRQDKQRSNLSLMAHLMRRAGFGATYEELEHCLEAGYEATIERLLYPEDSPRLGRCAFPSLPCGSQ